MRIGVVTATGREQVVRFEVHRGVPLVLGRSSRCSVQIHDPKVSREHCRLELLDEGLRVTDLGSSHGILQHGLASGWVMLRSGERCAIGRTELQFVADAGSGGAVADLDAPTPRDLPDWAPEPSPPPAAPIAPPPSMGAPAVPPWGGRSPVLAPESEPRPIADRIGAGGGYPDLVAPGRRPSQAGKRFLAKLCADLIVFTITAVLVVIGLALLKRLYDIDIYRWFGVA